MRRDEDVSADEQLAASDVNRELTHTLVDRPGPTMLVWTHDDVRT